MSTEDNSPRVGSPLWCYVASVTGTGVAVLVVVVTWLVMRPAYQEHLSQLAGKPLFWAVAALVLAGAFWPIVLPGRSDFVTASVAGTFCFAALLAWGLPVAVLLRTAYALVACFARGRRPYRVMFSMATSIVSMVVCAVVLRGLGVRMSPQMPWVPMGADVVKIVVALIVASVVGYFLLTAASAMRAREPLLRTVRRTASAVQVSVVVVAVAPAVAVMIHTMLAPLVLLSAVPLGLIHVNAAISMRRERQAHYDTVTGLSNRALLTSGLARALGEAGVSGTCVAFLVLDMDQGLTEVSAAPGHAVADQLLRLAAHRLTRSVRSGDLVARMSGSELAVLLTGLSGAAQALAVAARLRAVLAKPVLIGGMLFAVDASIGIAVYPDDADADWALMYRAASATYRARQRNTGIERWITLEPPGHGPWPDGQPAAPDDPPPASSPKPGSAS